VKWSIRQAASGGLSDVARTARLDPVPGADLAPEAMIGELRGLHGGLAAQLGTDIGICARRRRDPGIIENLLGLVSFREEAAGMPHSVLVPSAGGASAIPADL